MSRWWQIGVLLAVVAMSWTSFSLGRSTKVKMVDLNITVGVYDGKMRPLTGEGGVVLVVKQLSFSDRVWPEDHWSRISGVPNLSGDLSGKAKFPLDPQVTAEMARRAK